MSEEHVCTHYLQSKLGGRGT